MAWLGAQASIEGSTPPRVHRIPIPIQLPQADVDGQKAYLDLEAISTNERGGSLESGAIDNRLPSAKNYPVHDSSI
jgi:hypothetical protein